jgi:hypothetical protein
MSNNSLLEVQRKISEIENAIRERDVNKGITAYNTLRIYISDPSIDFQTKKLAHEKGIELHAILVQMRQEILQNEKIQATNSRTTQEQPTYADPMPLKSAKDTSQPQINFKAIIIVIIILGLLVGGTYLFMTGSNSGGCSVDGPFACKETSLKVSTDNLAQNYIILKMDQSKGIISQINITNISQSLKNCNNIYIDKTYSLTTNYQELKIMLDCKNIALSDVIADITLSYKLNGKEETSVVKLSTLQSAINTEIKETFKINTTDNISQPARNTTISTNITRNITTNTTRTNSTISPGTNFGGGGGGGGGSSGSGYSVDEVPPIVSMSVSSYEPTLNFGGTTFNITFTANGHANGQKVLSSLILSINGSSISCPNVSGIHQKTCTYIYNCSKSLMGKNITYYATATDDNDYDAATTHYTYLVPDFIVPSVNILTSNSSNLTSTPIIINGNASDNYLLSYVEYRINNGTWHNTTGTGNWSINASIRNGTNYVEVRATDSFNKVNSTIKTFTATLRPEYTMTIYNDSGLNVSWINTSYNSIINLSDNSVAYIGVDSMSFNGSTNGTLSLTKINSTIISNVDGYANLSFYINGTINTSIIVRVRGDANDSMFPDVNLSNLTGEWEYIEINMTELNPYRYPINKIEFIPTFLPDGATDIVFYVELLELKGIISDTEAPQIVITYPANNSIIEIPLVVNTTNITIRGNVTDDTYIDAVLVNVNGTIYNMTTTNYFTLATNVTHNWSGIITLNNDINLINITAYDTFGRIATYEWNVTLNLTLDTTSPNITINSGVTNNRTNQTTITITGNSSDNVNGTGLNITMWRMNFGPWHNISSNNSWTQTILLINDTNFVEVLAFDNSSNNFTKNITINYNYTTIGAVPMIIYDDNNLTINWTYENASIGQNVIVNSTDYVYCGNTSFRTDSNASGTLNIMLGNTTDGGMNSTNYTKVKFAIYANQSFIMYVQLGLINDTNNLYYNTSTFSIPNTTWYIVSVNVSSLMSNNTIFNSLGLTINETNNVTYYLDNVQIVP